MNIYRPLTMTVHVINRSWKKIAWDFYDVAVETEYSLKPLDTSTSLPE